MNRKQLKSYFKMNKEMVIVVVIFALLATAGTAWGQGVTPTEPQIFGQDQIQKQVAQQKQQQQMQQDQQQKQQQQQDQVNSQIAKQDQVNDQDQDNDQTTNINHKYRRQAPSIGLVVPNSTAPLMKCIGFGGSNETGSAVTGWCWLQRDLYAAYRAEQHAAAGRFSAAAKAQCAHKLFRSDFDSLEDCRASVYQSLELQRLESQELSSDEYEELLLIERAKYERDTKHLSDMLNEATKHGQSSK